MSALANGQKVSELDGEAPESTDFANYFCTYAYLYHQKDMLEDHKRTGAYYNAIMQNKRQFTGKVVLDVGTGTGILAIFAAKAGAKQVYAVEATAMASYAQKMVDANKLGSVIKVIKGTIETVSLPEKVDIIISEWMGYFLLRESMLDSVLHARDSFLKPGGALYPSHARMYLALIRSNLSHTRAADFQNSMEGWAEFAQDMQQYYGVVVDCLSEDFRAEQRDYYLQTSAWADIHPAQLLGRPVCFKEYDLHTLTIQELQQPVKANFKLKVVDGGPVEGFAGYFDVQFRGSPENPADSDVLLSTEPDALGSTHWGQQSFSLQPPVDCGPDDLIACSIEIVRKKENHRLMEIMIRHKVEGKSIYAENAVQRASGFHIE